MVTVRSDSEGRRKAALQTIELALKERGAEGEFIVEEFTMRDGQVCFDAKYNGETCRVGYFPATHR